MIILSILIILLIVFFEVSLKEVGMFSYFGFLFTLVNLFYWAKRYKLAIFSGVISSIIIDLSLQRNLGMTLFSLFLPILIFTVFDGLLQLESKFSRIIFSSIGAGFSVLIESLIFPLLFLKGSIFLSYIISKMLITTIGAIVFNTLFVGILTPKE